MSDPLDGRRDVDVSIGPQPDRPASMKMVGEDFAMKACAITFEKHAGARFELLPRMHQRVPQLGGLKASGYRRAASGYRRGVGLQWRQQKTLNGAAARRAVAEEPSWKDFRVVHDQQVPTPEIVTKLAKRREFRGAGVAMQDEQPRPPTNRRRLLGNQLIRKIEVEIGNVHGQLGS